MRYLVAYRDTAGTICKVDPGVTSGQELQDCLCGQAQLREDVFAVTKKAVEQGTPIMGLIMCDFIGIAA